MASAERLKELWDTEPDKLAEALTKILTDFGYQGIAIDFVKTTITNYYAGLKPQGIIAMFIHGWLEKGLES